MLQIFKFFLSNRRAMFKHRPPEMGLIYGGGQPFACWFYLPVCPQLDHNSSCAQCLARYLACVGTWEYWPRVNKQMFHFLFFS